MNEFVDFSSLLAHHMDRLGVGDARLETMVNNRFGHIFHISRSTVRNWKDGSSKSAADWRKIVAVAAVLNLSAVETEQLLEAAQSLKLGSLWITAQGDERALLEQWFKPLPVQLIEADLTEIKEGIDQLIEDDREILSQISQANSHTANKTPSPPPFILPQLEIPFFTGRHEELQQLERVLLNTEGQRVAGIAGLTGTGGMGKSALAYHFAKTYRDHFPDGVIGLRVDSGQVDTIAMRFAHHAGVEINLEKGLSASEIMQSVFSQKRALLIFDNAEDITTRVLQPGGEKCAVIVTTRNRSLLSHFGILQTALVDLPRFEYEETKQMLINMLREQRVLSEIEAVQDIHELVGGLPLALRIIGGFLTDQSFTALATYAAMLRNEKTRLSYLRDSDDPSLDVRASFELSLRYLDEEQIKLFACLGACAPEGFSLETARVVSEQDESITRNSLGRLIRLSLLSEGGNVERFVLHPLLYIFAREMAEGQELLAFAEQRHTEYFRRYADEHRDLSPSNLEALEREFDALLLTARRLTSSQVPDYGLYLSLEPFLQAKGYWPQALTLIELFLEVARAINDYNAVTQLLLQRGQFFQLQGRLDDAEQTLRQSESAANQINDNRQRQRVLAMVLNSLGGVYQRQGRLDEAINVFRQSAQIEEESENRRGQAMVLNSLGSAYLWQGRYDKAIDFFRQSAQIEEESGNRRGQAMVLNSLGSAYQRQGRFDEAVDAFQQSHSLLGTLGDKRGQAMVLNSLGSAYQRQGRFDEAISILKLSAGIEEEIGNERGQAMVLTSLGGIYQRQGKFDEAVDAFQQGVLIEERISNLRGQAIVLNSLGGVYQRQGKFDEAAEAFKQSHSLLTKLGDQRGQAMVLNSLGGVYQRQGKFDEAVDAFQRSYDISNSLNDQRSLAMVLNSLGGVYQRQGKFDEAVDAFQRSYAISGSLDDQRSLAMVLNSLGGVYQRQGKFDEAVDAFNRSHKLLVEVEDERGQAMVLNSLGGVYQRQGKFDEAVDAFQRSYTQLTEMGDEVGQAMVNFSYGKLLLNQNDFAQAVDKLKASFEINEKLRIGQGMRIVTPSLVRALTNLGRIDEANEYCTRALTVVPLDKRLMKLQEQLSFRYVVNPRATIKVGLIKRVVRNYAGYLYGFITPTDGSKDIYFGENETHPSLLPLLTEGIEVKAEVEQSARGPRARRVWKAEGHQPDGA